MSLTTLVDTTFTGVDLYTPATFVSVYEYTAVATCRLYIQARLDLGANLFYGAYGWALTLNDGDADADAVVAGEWSPLIGETIAKGFPQAVFYTALNPQSPMSGNRMWFNFPPLIVQAGDVVNVLFATGDGNSTDVDGSIRIFTDTAVTAELGPWAYEGAETFQALLRLIRAKMVGKAAGGETTTITYRDLADAKPRITETVDDAGNRSAVVVDGSD